MGRGDPLGIPTTPWENALPAPAVPATFATTPAWKEGTMSTPDTKLVHVVRFRPPSSPGQPWTSSTALVERELSPLDVLEQTFKNELARTRLTMKAFMR